MTLAAEKLHVSQPAVSNMLKKLETELGICLFDRKGKSIVLNENGKQFQKSVNTLFEILNRNRQQLYLSNTLTHQEIVIGFRTSETRFVNLLNSFRAVYPEAVFRLLSNQRLAYQDDAISIDFLFTAKLSHLRKADYVTLSYCEPLCPSVLMNRKHRLSQEAVISPEQLIGEPIIFMSPHTHVIPGEYKHLLDLGIVPNVRAITDDRFVLQAMISSGDMVGIVPYIDGYFMSNRLDLVSIPFNAPLPQKLHPTGQPQYLPTEKSPKSMQYMSKNIYFSWKSERSLSPAALAFRDFLFQEYSLTEGDIHHQE